MSSFRDIINSWPSIADFAADAGINDTHARTMRTRNSIPFQYWDAIIAGAKVRKIRTVSERVLKEIAKQSPPQRMPRRLGAAKTVRETIPANHVRRKKVATQSCPK